MCNLNKWRLYLLDNSDAVNQASEGSRRADVTSANISSTPKTNDMLLKPRGVQIIGKQWNVFP